MKKKPTSFFLVNLNVKLAFFISSSTLELCLKWTASEHQLSPVCLAGVIAEGQELHLELFQQHSRVLERPKVWKESRKPLHHVVIFSRMRCWAGVSLTLNQCLRCIWDQPGSQCHSAVWHLLRPIRLSTDAFVSPPGEAKSYNPAGRGGIRLLQTL